MQTILGAGGAIGHELAKSLRTYTNSIRLVGRNPQKVHADDELMSANLFHRDEVFAAVKGSDVCYVTAGFEYKATVWQERWPTFITNVVDACIEHQSKLVFFDNVYALREDGVQHILETSGTGPNTRKGKVRETVDNIILQNIAQNKLKAIIARSPDFFGPIKQNSLVMAMIYDNFKKSKKAQWFCNAKLVHSCGYAPDLALGTAMLGNTEDAFNQLWNLPVDPQRITGEQWVSLFANEMKVKDSYQVLAAWFVRILGLFIPVLGEMHEMLYQYDRDYYFDSSKFCTRFNFRPTSNAEAVRKTLQTLNGATSGTR